MANTSGAAGQAAGATSVNGGGGSGGADSANVASCPKYAEAVCRKTFECNPAAAPTSLGVPSSAECSQFAVSLCQKSVSEPPPACDPVQPSDAMVQACVSAIAAFDCSGWVVGDAPAECQTGVAPEPCGA